MPRRGKRHPLDIAPGVYRDGDDLKSDIVVFRSAGTVPFKVTTKEERFAWDTPPGELKLASSKHYSMALADSIKRKEQGTGAAHGSLVAAAFKRYVEKRQASPDPMTESELAQRTWILKIWARLIGNRRLERLDAELLLKLLGAHRLKDGSELSFSYKDKFITALSDVYKVLNGKTSFNPLRGIGRFEKHQAKGRYREVPLYVVDAIFAHMRDRGRGTTPSNTKAFLMAEAYTGIERADLVKLDPDQDIDWTQGLVYLDVRSKTGVVRTPQPVTRDGLDALGRCRLADCFSRADRYPSSSSMATMFHEACLEAYAALKAEQAAGTLPPEVTDAHLEKLRTMTTKDLRHTFITEALENTQNDNAARSLAGHAPGSLMIFRYGSKALDPIVEKTFPALKQAHDDRRHYVAPPTPLGKRAAMKARPRPTVACDLSSRTGYQRGCRCPGCCDANAAESRARRAGQRSA